MDIFVNSQIKLRLRQLTDSQTFYELIDRNREHLKEWLPWVDGVTNIEDVEKYIQTNIDDFANKKAVDFGVWYEDNLVGSVGTNKMDNYNKKTEIGYWLDKEYTGKGIMLKSVKSFTKYLFDNLDINRIEIKVSPENKKSLSIPEKLGFIYEGTMRESEFINGKFFDNRLYSLLRKDNMNNF